MSIFFKKKSPSKIPTTYRLGLLQAKVYRILNAYMCKQLKSVSITAIEWAFLGLLYDEFEGMKLSEAAYRLGVKAPFITAMIKDLQKLKLIEQFYDESDRRMRFVALTKKGRDLVPLVEGSLRESLKQLVQGVSVRDVLGYYRVLSNIEKNTPKDFKKILSQGVYADDV